MDRKKLVEELIAEKKLLEESLARCANDIEREQLRFEIEMLDRQIDFAKNQQPGVKQVIEVTRELYFFEKPGSELIPKKPPDVAEILTQSLQKLRSGDFEPPVCEVCVTAMTVSVADSDGGSHLFCKTHGDDFLKHHHPEVFDKL